MVLSETTHLQVRHQKLCEGLFKFLQYGGPELTLSTFIFHDFIFYDFIFHDFISRDFLFYDFISTTFFLRVYFLRLIFLQFFFQEVVGFKTCEFLFSGSRRFSKSTTSCSQEVIGFLPRDIKAMCVPDTLSADAD